MHTYICNSHTHTQLYFQLYIPYTNTQATHIQRYMNKDMFITYMNIQTHAGAHTQILTCAHTFIYMFIHIA